MTGNPITPVVGSVYNASTDTYKPRLRRHQQRAQQRLPSAGPARREELARRAGSVAAYLDVQNAYNRHNEEGRAYNFDFTQVGVISGLPLIPSLGVRGEI